MSAIDDLIAAWALAFPRYVAAGIASSGPGRPSKLLVMQLGQKIADAIATASGGDGTLAYATVADMNADLAHDANTQAAVYADAGGDTTNHNGIWTKVGASGSGSWMWLRALSIVELALRLDALEALNIDSRLAAVEADSDTMAAYRREMTERPGDAPELFSDAYAGTPDASTETVLTPATVTNGKILQLSGAKILARRGWVRIEPNRKYLVRAIAQRATDPVDPLGDAVELGMAWFTNAGAAVSGTPTSVIGTFSALTVAGGRTQKQAIIALASGDDITNIAPAGTVYARPYVRSYGADGLTNIEVLEVKDVTDAIGDSIAQSLVDDAIEAAATVQAVETEVQGLRDDALAAAASAGADLWSRPTEEIIDDLAGGEAEGYRALLSAANATHPNQVVEIISGSPVYSGAPKEGQVLRVGLITYRFNGSAWALSPYVVSADDYDGDAHAAAVAVGQTDQIAAPSVVKSPYYPELEGAKPGDATFDSTAAINAAIVYATDQGRVLKIGGVFYTGAGDGGVKLQAFSMIEGNGYATGFAVKDDAGAGDHVTYYDPMTCLGTVVKNLTFDGRKSSVASIVDGVHNVAADGGSATSGHPGHRWDTIYIKNYTGRGQSVGYAQRSSFFTNFTILGCNSYGLRDSSADCLLSNYDIGQCWADTNAASNPAGWYSSTPAGQRSNFKVWGTGQYGGILAVPGILVRNASDCSFTNVWTQESGGPGLSIYGSGQTVPGVTFLNYASDGDGIVAGQAAIVLNNTEGLHLIGRAGKWADTLNGTPQDAIAILGSVKNSFIRLHAKGYSRRPLTISAGATANDIDINGNTRGTLDHAYAASFTSEWYDAATHTMTLTGTTAVGAPTQSPDGMLLTFAFLNDVGAAAPTFNAAYLPPPNWATDFVTTAGKRNAVTFRRSDAAAKWIAQSVVYGM